MQGDLEPSMKVLLSVFYSGSLESVNRSERAEAARKLQRIYHLLTLDRAPVPPELERFIADLGRMIFGASDPEKALRAAFGKDLKKGRPPNADSNRDRALRMHRLVQSGVKKDSAAAQLDTTPDQSEARKYLRAYKEYRSVAVEAAAEEAWPHAPEHDDPLGAALDWIAEPINSSTK